MDDPWADTPSTPQASGSLRSSIDIPGPSTRTISSPRKEASKELKPETGDEDEVVQAVKDDIEPIADPEPISIEEDDEGFDDFDDFDAPDVGPSFSVPSGEGGEDGFGDFGDFEEGDFTETGDEVGVGGVGAEAGEGGSGMIEEEKNTRKWAALNLRPFPTRPELLGQLSEILSPLVHGTLPGDSMRTVGGLSQVMVGESSRDAYAQLTTAPILKPLDWTRSRIRREHLISMGVPVNLDEVDSHRISALPPLRITTAEGRRATSLDTRNGSSGSRDKGKGKEDGPRSAAPGTGTNGNENENEHGERGKYGLGIKPEFDSVKAEELCGLEEDRLSILPLSTLRQIQDELVKTSAQASSSLAWGLQLKDAQSHDSATYNGMISELISNAAKAKSAQQTGSGVFRRSSQKVRPASGVSTPRVGSPAMR